MVEESHVEGMSLIPEMSIGESALLTDLAMCINYYRLFTPGLYCCVHVPLQLDEQTRLCPGILAMVNHGKFKQCDPEPDYEYFLGGPNFVLDVFPAGDQQEYKRRRDAYERAKVLEYVAVSDTDPVTWIWNRLVDGKFVEVETTANEFIMSIALPGLWIPPDSLRHRNWWSIMGAIARGVTRVEHHQFMDAIWNAGREQAT